MYDSLIVDVGDVAFTSGGDKPKSLGIDSVVAVTYRMVVSRLDFHWIATSRFVVRRYKTPSAIAGVANNGSPMSFFASNSNSAPAFTT